MTKKKKKVRRVVLGIGSFGFSDFGKSVELWRADNHFKKSFGYGKLTYLEAKKVRLIAEVLEP